MTPDVTIGSPSTKRFPRAWLTLALTLTALAGANAHAQAPAARSAQGEKVGPPVAATIDYADFKTPPTAYRGHAWFTYQLASIKPEAAVEMVRGAVKTGSYGGFMITTSPAFRRPGATPAAAPAMKPVGYLSDEYFTVFKAAIDEGAKNNLPMDILYDELQFPTGMAGGLFAAKYPQHVEKSLEAVEQDVTGPTSVDLTWPAANSTYLGVTLLNLDTLETRDISTEATPREGGVKAPVPAGRWKAMAFYLDGSLRRGVCDYLSATAIDELIGVMYDRYYEKLAPYFGGTIKAVFYDEPSMHNNVRGRLWSPDFDAAFQKKFGGSPLKYYPALWYDIGQDTSAARNALFGLRADMYTENFIGRIAAWCAAHGVDLMGHMDQEEAPNPVGTQGDLMKVFKHQQIPTIDDIWFTGRSNTAYKIIASSAYNWDKPIIAAETYAAYQRNWQNATAMWRTALDQHAMGISFQVGNRLTGGETVAMGDFVGRTEYLLRGGRHVADIAILYPIAALRAAYQFAQPVSVQPVTPGGRAGGEPGFYYALEGGIPKPQDDYLQIGEMLFRGMRIDYTYLHPEILETNCSIGDGRLTIENKVNREAFRVLIVPGSDTLSVATARKIRDFYRAGGAVVATGVLPSKSAEFHQDAEVQQIVGEVFGIPARGPMTASIRAFTDDFKTFFAHVDPKAGKAYFLPRPDPKMIGAVLQEALPVRDVDVKLAPTWPGKTGMEYDGSLTYIHKVKDGHDLYYFANSTEADVDTQVVLRGDKKLERWNALTGEKEACEATVSGEGDKTITTVRLKLPPLTAAFFIQP